MSDANNGLAQPIIPHLWFDKEAKEAAEFYCSVFPHSKITSSTTLNDTPSGDAPIVSFTVWGHPFMAISAGPLFKLNPSISFFVNFDPSREPNAGEMLEEAWNKLSDGGTPLMPLDKYPFSERYGWIQDKYGVSWQLILTNPHGEPRPPIIPSLMFVGDNCGKAEEAREFYLSVFRNAKPGALVRYASGMEPDREGDVMFSDFMLENTWFTAMDSAHEHSFQFNEAISLLVDCTTQEEIDYYWDKLSALPEAEQCGWLKDKYGVSWQISPAALDKMMNEGTPEQRDRVTKAFLKMKKFNIAELERAYLGNEPTGS
ncbi:VOC family protein [Paenibacillus sp. PAMC21692]|uniref:VOC family protein n=1 Tax=Paenibacillus sp. PAMC21692 TaxID=2762320 RepID=UPI00164E6BE6|nr:VOC family protein [Paenibacillus sp. PAMC21692]QNK55882.1 VOC family protein [Paenibacillus sp. PAMC21692]